MNNQAVIKTLQIILDRIKKIRANTVEKAASNEKFLPFIDREIDAVTKAITDLEIYYENH